VFVVSVVRIFQTGSNTTEVHDDDGDVA